MNESIVAKTTITLPANGGTVKAVSTIEAVPYWTRSRKSGEDSPRYHRCDTCRLYTHLMVSTAALAMGDTTTDLSTTSEAPSTPVPDCGTPRANGRGKKHEFVPKTVRLYSEGAHDTHIGPSDCLDLYLLSKRSSSLSSVPRVEEEPSLASSTSVVRTAGL